MKLRTIIWSVVLFGCIVLGIWQRQNISIFWHEYHALWRDYDYHKHSLVPHKPLIPENIARTDPEAAAVADIILRGYFGRDGYLPALAENLLKFPDNELFLFSCLNEVFELNELDQEISVKLAEKLIDLDKDNSLYHYLKAASLLANRQNNDITPVLNEINTAAICPNFYFPYAKYTQRTVNVAERAKLHSALMEVLSSPHFYASWAHDSQGALLRYAHRAFTDGENEKGLLIDDTINSIGKNQLDAGYNEARLIMNSKMLSRFGYWSCPEMLELQRADITEQRARQNRLQLCPYVLPRIKSKETKDRKDSDFDKESQVTDKLIIALPVAVHNGRMLFAMAGVWLALIAACMVRGWSDTQRTGITALLSFAVVSLCYFFIASGLFLFLFLTPLSEICRCCFSHTDIMRPMPLDWEHITDLPPIYLFLPLICPVLAALLLWSASHTCNMSFWWRILLKLILTFVVSAIAATLLGMLMYFAHEWMDLPEFLPTVVFIFIFALLIAMFASWLSKLRFVRGILVVMPLGTLTALASPYAYISQIPLILFVVICTLIVLNKPSEPVPFIKALRGIFSKWAESAAIRSRAVKLLALFIVIHWLFFTASVPTCARYIDRLYPRSPWSYPKLNLAPADETSYQQVLARFDSNDFTLFDFHKLIPLVMPQDLPAVLNTTKNKIFSSSYPYRPLKSPAEHSDVNSSLEQSRQKEIKIRDWNIIDTMQGCGRDVVNILADSMDNPEQEFAMLSRARLGDTQVKKKLEQLLASRLANGEPPEPNEHRHYWDRTAKTVDIICALACISEPNEAGTRFLDYTAKHDVSQLLEDFKFFEGIWLLPTSQAREVIKAYLAKAQEWQPPERVMCDGEVFREDPSRALSPVREVVVTYADRDITEAVFKIMLRSQDDDIKDFWWGLWEVPQDFDAQSADLLRQGLASDNDQLRAWCAWQLRKTSYTFSEDEMSRLLADESWKVRVNAIVAGGPKTAGRVANDQNPFVRWVASLIAGE
jgi:hypothetical protein